MSIFMIISILGGFIVFVAAYSFFIDEIPCAILCAMLTALTAFGSLFFCSTFVANVMERLAANDCTEKEVLFREYNVVKTDDKVKINIDENKGIGFYSKDENGVIELKKVPFDEFASIVESDENEVIVGEYVTKVTGKRCDFIHGCRIETWDKLMYPNIAGSPKVAHRFKIHVPKNMLDDFI